MLSFLGRRSEPAMVQGNPSYLLDLSQLKPDEFIEFRYDDYQRLTSVRKLSCLSSGGIATVETEIPPDSNGKVMWRGTLWRARNEENHFIAKGQTVFVVAQKGLTLFVRPA